MQALKKCYECNQLKDLFQFNKNKSKKDGLAGECRQCRTQYNHNYRKSYKTHIIGRARTLLGSARRRAKQRNGIVSIDMDWIVEILEKGTCQLSGLPFDFDQNTKIYSRSPYVPSLDRIDINNPNYTPENTRVILWCINGAILEYGLEHLLMVTDSIKNLSK